MKQNSSKNDCLTKQLTNLLATDIRQAQLAEWSFQELELEHGQHQWRLVSGDASFRRYFRIIANDKSWICVDAPPEHENSRQFVAIANLLSKVNAPRVISTNFDKGFMLLSDLGDELFLPLLLSKQEDSSIADLLYHSAIDSLLEMQKIDVSNSLPKYNTELLNNEMELFREWFVSKHLQLSLSEQEHKMLDQVFELLTDSALEQPQVFVHRDYHSRNLMHVKGESPGIIDFQDAVVGPISYDLLSLLRDCYIQWKPEEVEKWVDYYLAKSEHNIDKQQFIRWFDWMGLQRHIKVAGIFCRLNYRDDKEGYLKDIPLTLTYIILQSEKYAQLKEFTTWMKSTILPAMTNSMAVNKEDSK